MPRRRLHPIHAPAGEAPHPWNSRLDVVIAVALGLAAIVTAGSVYLNEHQEHSAEVDFHQATHELIVATTAGLRTPAGRALAATSESEVTSAEGHQDKAERYTLAEVILATSLFLFGVAGLSTQWRLRVGVFGCATGVFLVAVVVLATV